MLKRFGINPKNLDLEQLQADYNALQVKKTELQRTYKSAEKEVADLNRKLANIKQYLHQEQTPEQSNVKKLNKVYKVNEIEEPNDYPVRSSYFPYKFLIKSH